MNLKEKVFQNHNELLIRDGRKFITVCNTMVCTEGDTSYFGKDRYDLNLNHDAYKTRDIMKAVNPFTNEVIYERDETDWSNVPIDTKVLVRDGDYEEWKRAYFKKFNKDKIYKFETWPCGSNSWSYDGVGRITSWDQCKLYDK